ncbi:uncharacterized protein LAJ45_07428 [Morchella importuna]|uniref:uncharacterized protein n=1 Tax=Morchella importuna TaxID=1174673 RepID=UPI001E8E0BDA|nr:uncharacterized protein LAJ45_07428 [Morchella importuna]KAH8148327.1 hypothetical protein LAJ45_07428 [Morchella importuna]
MLIRGVTQPIEFYDQLSSKGRAQNHKKKAIPSRGCITWCPILHTIHTWDKDLLAFISHAKNTDLALMVDAREKWCLSENILAR